MVVSVLGSIDASAGSNLSESHRTAPIHRHTSQSLSPAPSLSVSLSLQPPPSIATHRCRRRRRCRCRCYHRDHLYGKGDFDGAIVQYEQTLGFLVCIYMYMLARPCGWMLRFVFAHLVASFDVFVCLCLFVCVCVRVCVCVCVCVSEIRCSV